uniref:ETS domain-containing protein n=1 Tax=Macrostomum lignano TaxID=282301 RepID=A0A1I8G9H1_9PLAT
MDLSSDDLLLQLTRRSDDGLKFHLSQSHPRALLEKSASFDSLVHELFNDASEPEVATAMNIQQCFINDSKSGEEALKSWLPPPGRSSPKSMDIDSPPPSSSIVSQPVSSGMTNMAQTLEYPGTLQVTQEPRHPIPEQGGVPTLPVFKACPPRQLPLLETVDPDIVDEILSPLSATSGTEVTQPAQTPQMEMQTQPQQQLELTPQEQPSLKRHSKVAKVKSGSAKSRGSSSSTEREDLSEKVGYIQRAVANYHKKGAAACSNGKIQVHEVVLAILQAGSELNFNKVLSFCTEDGTETDEVSENFVARDTKLMGLIWQSLKGNRNGNFDTFARAMRVGRERQKDYFDYLSGGKASKKRVYKLGPKALKEYSRMRKVFQDKW